MSAPPTGASQPKVVFNKVNAKSRLEIDRYGSVVNIHPGAKWDNISSTREKRNEYVSEPEEYDGVRDVHFNRKDVSDFMNRWRETKDSIKKGVESSVTEHVNIYLTPDQRDVDGNPLPDAEPVFYTLQLITLARLNHNMLTEAGPRVIDIVLAEFQRNPDAVRFFLLDPAVRTIDGFGSYIPELLTPEFQSLPKLPERIPETSVPFKETKTDKYLQDAAKAARSGPLGDAFVVKATTAIKGVLLQTKLAIQSEGVRKLGIVASVWNIMKHFFVLHLKGGNAIRLLAMDFNDRVSGYSKMSMAQINALIPYGSDWDTNLLISPYLPSLLRTKIEHVLQLEIPRAMKYLTSQVTMDNYGMKFVEKTDEKHGARTKLKAEVEGSFVAGEYEIKQGRPPIDVNNLVRPSTRHYGIRVIRPALSQAGDMAYEKKVYKKENGNDLEKLSVVPEEVCSKDLPPGCEDFTGSLQYSVNYTIPAFTLHRILYLFEFGDYTFRDRMIGSKLININQDEVTTLRRKFKSELIDVSIVNNVYSTPEGFAESNCELVSLWMGVSRLVTPTVDLPFIPPETPESRSYTKLPMYVSSLVDIQHDLITTLKESIARGDVGKVPKRLKRLNAVSRLACLHPKMGVKVERCANIYELSCDVVKSKQITDDIEAVFAAFDSVSLGRGFLERLAMSAETRPYIYNDICGIVSIGKRCADYADSIGPTVGKFILETLYHYATIMMTDARKSRVDLDPIIDRAVFSVCQHIGFRVKDVVMDDIRSLKLSGGYYTTDVLNLSYPEKSYPGALYDLGFYVLDDASLEEVVNGPRIMVDTLPTWTYPSDMPGVPAYKLTRTIELTESLFTTSKFVIPATKNGLPEIIVPMVTRREYTYNIWFVDTNVSLTKRDPAGVIDNLKSLTPYYRWRELVELLTVHAGRMPIHMLLNLLRTMQQQYNDKLPTERDYTFPYETTVYIRNIDTDSIVKYVGAESIVLTTTGFDISKVNKVVPLISRNVGAFPMLRDVKTEYGSEFKNFVYSVYLPKMGVDFETNFNALVKFRDEDSINVLELANMMIDLAETMYYSSNKNSGAEKMARVVSAAAAAIYLVIMHISLPLPDNYLDTNSINSVSMINEVSAVIHRVKNMLNPRVQEEVRKIYYQTFGSAPATRNSVFLYLAGELKR